MWIHDTVLLMLHGTIANTVHTDRRHPHARFLRRHRGADRHHRRYRCPPPENGSYREALIKSARAGGEKSVSNRAVWAKDPPHAEDDLFRGSPVLVKKF